MRTANVREWREGSARDRGAQQARSVGAMPRKRWRAGARRTRPEPFTRGPSLAAIEAAAERYLAAGDADHRRRIAPRVRSGREPVGDQLATSGVRSARGSEAAAEVETIAWSGTRARALYGRVGKACLELPGAERFRVQFRSRHARAERVALPAATYAKRTDSRF